MDFYLRSGVHFAAAFLSILKKEWCIAAVKMKMLMHTWVTFFSSERYILTQAMWNHLLMHALIEIQIFFKINNLFNIPGEDYGHEGKYYCLPWRNISTIGKLS